MSKTKEQVRYNMQQVKNKNSEIEKLLRRALWKAGYRYRKNVKSVYGHPDIVIMKKKIAIFCDSEFWHGYDWENRKTDFKVRRDFWIPKIERNIERDKDVTLKLESEGWTVLRFWGKEIKNSLEKCVELVDKAAKEKCLKV